VIAPRRRLLVVATALVAGCPSQSGRVVAPTPAPAPTADAAVRLRVAQAEARRADGASELLELFHHGNPAEQALAARGLARIGEPPAELQDAVALAETLDEKPPTTPIAMEQHERAALELGRRGRKKIALTEPQRAKLLEWTNDPDRAVRFAATYALAREHEPPANPATLAALSARIADADGETRAQAIDGLARREAIAMALPEVIAELGDPDWRVEIAAIRALVHEPDGRAAVTRLVTSTRPQVAIEALHLLQPYGGERAVADALGPLRDAPGWGGCLATAALERAAAHPSYGAVEHCGRDELSDAHRLALVADMIVAHVGDLGARREALRVLAEHVDPRVRAAALPALPALWHEAEDDADHRALVAQLAAAIASPDLGLAGAAVEAAPAMYETIVQDPLRAQLDAAIVARANRERDVELSADLHELIGKQHIAAGAQACRDHVMQTPPVVARAAAKCLADLGEAVVAPGIPPAVPPPVDVAAVIGRDLRWHLQTTRGEIVIHLLPDVAPWAVAMVVQLSRKGFYDHTEFHRVVPGFVVQGGDPTGTGAGGPGFTLPAEPALPSDGPGFIAGAVGIADAGRDSGGSQFFIMHARAPHLDGRYTWFGQVIAGQDVADALVIGDRVVHATIEER